MSKSQGKRMTLQELDESESRQALSLAQLTQFGISEAICSMTFSQAQNYNVSGPDGRKLAQVFLDSPSVDRALVPNGWISNHQAVVVWTLASLERSFPNTLRGICSFENILQRLLRRYQKELCSAQRPPLRRILEQDDAPNRLMILCVTRVFPSSETVELTDGWYTIQAKLDAPLTRFVRSKRIHEGQKLCVWGAELSSSTAAHPTAAHPLEQSDTYLQLHGNSTRIARWDSKLGYQKVSRPKPVLLSSLFHDGGAIGLLDVVVVRSLPVEILEIKADGTKIRRNARAEETAARSFAAEKERITESVLRSLEKQWAQQKEQHCPPKPVDQVRQLGACSKLM